MKKVFGYLFYLLGVLFVMSFIGNIMRGFQAESGIEIFERIAALLFAGGLAFVFFKYANKWTRKKKPVKSEIDNIGDE